MKDSCPEVRHNIPNAFPGISAGVYGIAHQLNWSSLQSMLMEGFKPQVTILDDTSMDAPSAYGFMAQLLVQSTLAQAKIEELAHGMEGEGLKPPKDRLLAKVQDVQS